MSPSPLSHVPTSCLLTPQNPVSLLMNRPTVLVTILSSCPIASLSPQIRAHPSSAVDTVRCSRVLPLASLVGFRVYCPPRSLFRSSLVGAFPLPLALSRLLVFPVPFVRSSSATHERGFGPPSILSHSFSPFRPPF